jgi:hypothetical protein
MEPAVPVADLIVANVYQLHRVGEALPECPLRKVLYDH